MQRREYLQQALFFAFSLCYTTYITNHMFHVEHYHSCISMNLKPIKKLGELFPWISIVATTILPFLTITQRYSYAKTLGSISLVLFILTLLPGIVRRFKLISTSWGKFIIQALLPIRRQLGISMFITAFAHNIGLNFETFQRAFETGVPPELAPFKILGIIAFYLLVPLFVTSNKFSTRILKAWWKRLHRLTYIIGWLIFGHVALQGISWQSIVIGVVMIIEVSSLVYASLKK